MSDRPLQSKRIVITRDAGDAESVAGALHALGARTILFPTIRIEATDDWIACDAALEDLGGYAWVVFSSRNSVRFFLDRMREKGIAFTRQRIAALGRKTAEELQGHGLASDLVPGTYTAEGLLSASDRMIRKGERVLLPVSNIARSDLYDGLENLGALPDRVVVYRTLPNRGQDAIALKAKLESGDVDCLTFFSPSAFTNFIEIFGRDFDAPASGAGPAIAAIGPTTAGAIKQEGLEPDIVPLNSTEEDLVRAIVAYYKRNK